MSKDGQPQGIGMVPARVVGLLREKCRQQAATIAALRGIKAPISCMAANVKILAGEVNADASQMHQIGGRLVA